MEEQTAKSNVGDGQQNDIPLLQSMLLRLMSPKKRAAKRNTSKSHEHPDATSQSMFYQYLGSEDIAIEDRNNLDSTVRSDGDEKQPTSSSKTEDEKVEERKSPLPVSLPTQTEAEESSQEPKEGELLEDKNKTAPSVEEHMAGAASLLDNPSQPSSASASHLSMSSDRCDTAQMEYKHEQLDETCGGPSNLVGMDTSSFQSHQTVVDITSRTARSASDPVTQKRKEERPLSAPSISERWEYANSANLMKRFSKAAVVLGWEDSDMSSGGMEQENSLAKTQKKGVKNKMKNLTHKLIEKLKEKHYFEHTDSKSIQDSGEEEAQCLNPMEVKAEAEAANAPPPLPPKKGKYVFLNRKFTLKDFKLNLEPINLMDEIFTGNEWLNYLPSKTSPAERDTSDQMVTEKDTSDQLMTEKDTSDQTVKEKDTSDQLITEKDTSDQPMTEKDTSDQTVKEKDTSDQPMTEKDTSDQPMTEKDSSDQQMTEKDTIDQPMKYDVVQTEKDTQLNITLSTAEQDKSEDIKNNQEDVSDAQQDNVAEVNSHGGQMKQDANIFAIPKALLTNNEIKQRAPVIDCELKKSGDIYDRLDMYIIPKNDLPLIKCKSSDASPMDFSAVKSFGLLDNSALKIRIRLSKKRPHKPPQKVKKEKSNTKFYKIPGVILN